MSSVITFPAAAAAPKLAGSPAASRPLYNGGLSEEELARPGSKLLAMLMHRASQLGHRQEAMCADLGVTYGYIHQLRSGTRQVRHISDEFAAACSLYLGVPRLTVLLVSGRIRASDFRDAEAVAPAELRRAMEFISQDLEFAHLVPPQAFELSPALQLLIIELYEKATSRKLLAPGICVESLLVDMAAADEVVQRLRDEVEAGAQKKARNAEVAAE